MRWLCLAIPLVLVVGCGDDDDDGGGVDTAPPITDEPIAIDAAPEATPPDAEPPPEPEPPAATESPAPTEPPAPTDQSEAEGMPYCETTAAMSDAFGGLDFSGATPADELEEDVMTYTDLLGMAEGLAPPQLADAYTVYIAPQSVLFGELADVQYDATRLPPAAFAFTQDPAFMEANEAIFLYDVDVCGAGQ